MHSIFRITLLVLGSFASLAGANTLASGQKVVSTFDETIELSPFSVQGEDLSISIYARSQSDRRYAERFSDSVVELAYETIGKTTGHGLVIVGDKGEPHPIFVMRKFLDMAQNGQLEGDFTQAIPELEKSMETLETSLINFEDGDDSPAPITFDQIVNAIPLPLQGIGTKLYIIAWSEGFDPERVEQRLKRLNHQDLESEALSQYDWVFYLPPKKAFDKVLKTLFPVIAKEAKLGFFKRTALRGALALFKPLIKDAVEGFRKGVLYTTVLQAMSDYNEGDREALTMAYIESIMPRGKLILGNKQQRAREAIAAQKTANIEYAKDPYITPERLENYDIDTYSKFVGDYGAKGDSIRRFTIKDGDYYWQTLGYELIRVYPASGNRVVFENGERTLELLTDETGATIGVEERLERQRFILPFRTMNDSEE